MKKLNKLFAILFAVLGVTTLKAQTDVTDQYLTNPGFEETKWEYAKPQNDRAIYKPKGWSIEYKNGDANDMTYVATSMNQDGKTWNAKEGNSFFTRQRWANSTITLYQTLTNLLPGKYTLTFDAALFGAGSSVLTVLGTETEVIRTLSVGKNDPASWTSITQDFEITSETPNVTIKIASTRNGNNFKSGYDNFRLSYDGTSYYNTYIATIETLYNENRDWAVDVSALEEAIANAKIKANKTEAISELEKAVDAFRTANSIDMTSKITNPNFDSNISGWITSGSDGTWQRNSSSQKNFSGGFIETWRNAWGGTWNHKNFDIHQDLTGLPNGEYTISANIIAALQGSGGPYLRSKNEGVWMYGASGDENNVVFAATEDAAATWGEGGKLITVRVKVTDGKLTIGTKAMGSSNGGTSLGTYCNWFACDNWRLSYMGFDPTALLTQLESLKDEANLLLGNNDYKKVAGAERTALEDVIKFVPEETKTGLETAIIQLESLINAFKVAKSDYDALATEKTIAEGLGMSADIIESATATTKTGLVALQDLKVAEYKYIQGTYTENATLGSWTEDFAEDLSGEGYNTNGSKYFNEWGNATRTAKQAVKLPAGDYAIYGIGRGQIGTSGYLYYKIGEETTKVDFIMKGNRGRGVDVNGVANFSDEGEYNCNGEGFGWEYRFITFHLDTETEVEIGVSATFANAWVSIYAPVLLTTEASVKALRMTEIANLLSTVPAGKMKATVQSTLDEKEGAAEAASAEENTIDELSTIATELNEAIIAANASIAEYEKIATYIAKANTIDESIAANVQTQYDNGALDKAEPVFQALEVATYNYVKTNFNYDVALSKDWNKEGPVGELSDQHWSGEKRPYMEQSSAAWGWDAWSISYDQDLTLPAGKYVFKVAGRKAAGNGCTLNLTVTSGGNVLGTVNDFPEGDQGYGIDTSGAANFSEEGTYANNDNGRGWQWRYVKFTLENEATVNIAVNAEATTNHQWISFCDATVQMTEETYLEVNKGGLDAPTAAANALVDSKPMGTAENDALKAALALPVTTGEELLAKINALNAAVADANAWIADYNTAKAPLVAALERFETDYNDAENGAIDHMNKERWTTAVNMAQAAAVAKDVTYSYEGFATATENLVAALEAATVSVGEYADLKKAIDEANTLASANVGDQPFERPQSAADAIGIANAQDVYDAATADGEGVTSVTTSLNEAVTTFKAVPLNAPAEGFAYNLVLNNNNGWSYDGKAVTYIEGGRTDAGLYNISYLTEPNVNYAQAFTFTAVEDQADCYTLSMTDVDGNQRYVCTGVPYNGTTGQLRTTTIADDALVVKVIATTTDGVHNLYNTEANNYIGSQDDGFYTVNSHINFNLVAADKAKVTLSISKAGWATLILPFNAEIPEGITVYASKQLNEESVALDKVESIVANTPYLISGTEGTYKFSGYGLAYKNSYEDENGLFVGTYVDYTTVGGEYVLQKPGDVVAFYCVGESAKPTVKAYRCYLTAPANGIKAFFFGDEVTGINGVDTADAEIEAIYTINGTRVNNLQKGLNIVKMSNGKTQKVYVK